MSPSFRVFRGLCRGRYAGALERFLNTGYKYIWAAAALVLFITALCLAFLESAAKSELRAVVLEEDPDSSIRITLDALKELAARYLKDIPGVITGKNWSAGHSAAQCYVATRAFCAAGDGDPRSFRKIAAEIKEYVGKYSGVEVSRVEISIQPA